MSGSSTDPACIFLDKANIARDYERFTTPFVSKFETVREISPDRSLLFIGGRASIYRFFVDHPDKPIIEAKDKNLGAMSFTFVNSPIDLYKKIKRYALLPAAAISVRNDIRIANTDGSRRTLKQSFKAVKESIDQKNATYTIFEIFQAQGPRYEAKHKNIPHLVFHTAREVAPWTVLGTHMAELFLETLDTE